ALRVAPRVDDTGRETRPRSDRTHRSGASGPDTRAHRAARRSRSRGPAILRRGLRRPADVPLLAEPRGPTRRPGPVARRTPRATARPPPVVPLPARRSLRRSVRERRPRPRPDRHTPLAGGLPAARGAGVHRAEPRRRRVVPPRGRRLGVAARRRRGADRRRRPDRRDGPHLEHGSPPRRDRRRAAPLRPGARSRAAPHTATAFHTPDRKRALLRTERAR